MHVTQGLVDVGHAQWDPQTMVLSGTARRAPGDSGAVVVYMPPDYAVADGEQADMVGAWCARVDIAFDGAEAPWLVRFRRTDAGEAPPLNPEGSILRDASVAEWRG